MVVAGIVTYNPDIERLKENMDSICLQVGKVIILDNGSSNAEIISEFIKQYNNVEMICNDQNKGIAKALNQIIAYAKKIGAEWVLTLDQDSVCSENVIEKYMQYQKIPNIAMITGKIRDRNFGFESSDQFQEDYIFINSCITSGCFTNVEACIQVGGFDEQMFIDFIDFDMCFMLREKGYRLIKLNYECLLHELGRTKKKRILGNDFLIMNHSPIRKYYYSRNVVYFFRKHRKFLNKFFCHKKILVFILAVILYEQGKYEKLKAIIKGISDGKTMKIE